MTKQSEGDINEVISSSIEYGLGVLEKDHPLFNQEYLHKNIDKTFLTGKIKEISKELEAKNTPPEERAIILSKGLANYVASGNALNNEARKAVLRGGLEEKAESWNLVTKFFSRRKLKGEKYLDNTILAFQNIYSILKKGDYAERMPGLAKAIQTIHDAGFFKPAVEILGSYGLITKNIYKNLKDSIVKKVKESSDEVYGSIGDYFAQKVAAGFIGLVGIIMVAGSFSMTGGIIGTLGNTGVGLAGAFFFILALFLFFAVSKRKKSKTFKNR